MRLVGLLLIGSVVAGCAPRADQVFAAEGRILTGSSGAIPGYGVKLIAGKQRQDEVLGDDGSVCRLTRKRFQRTQVGDWLACDWTIAPAGDVAQADRGART